MLVANMDTGRSEGDPVTQATDTNRYGSLKETSYNETVPVREQLVLDTIRECESILSHHGEVRCERQLRALTQVARALVDMAFGLVEPLLYVSPVDIGIGKTTLLATFARVLARTRDLRDVGMVIFVDQLAQMPALKAAINVPGAVGFFCRDQALMKENGAQDHTTFQILIATQQVLKAQAARWKGQPFANLDAFKYAVEPRLVRAWDEKFNFNTSVILHHSSVAALPNVLERRHPDLADAIAGLADAIYNAKTGQRVLVPARLSLDEATSSRAEQMIADPNLLECFRRLRPLAGQRVAACARGRALVTFERWMPEGLLPLLVMDASARVTKHNTISRDSGLPVHLLEPAVWDYSNLTVHVWDRSGSKEAIRQDGASLVTATAEVINAEPEHHWLIVQHSQESTGVNFEREVRDLLTGIDTRAQFVPWGRHRSSNDFRHCDRVVLAGTLFLPYAATVANVMASSGDDLTYPDSGLVAEMLAGELDDGILQAVGRSAVRAGRDGRCGHAHVYIIVAERHGVADRLQESFPGCQIEEWIPGSVSARATRRAKARAAATFIIEYFKVHSGEVLSVQAVMAHVEIDNYPTFRRTVCDKPEFREKIARAGMRAHTGPRGKITGFADFKQW
jgi:hypothetical protein